MKGIITAAARLYDFPTPLCATAEQLYVSGLAQGFGSDDDSGMVRLYFPDPIASVSQSQNSPIKTKLIIALLTNIHLCAAAEAISFAQHLNVDMAQYQKLVNAAAGSSTMFRKRAMEMVGINNSDTKNGTYTCKTIDEAASEIAEVIQEARNVNCPVHLASEALNLLLMAKRKGLGGKSDSHIIHVYNRDG